MDDNRCQSPLLLSRAAGWCSKKIIEYRAALVSALLVGLMCYLYAFTNKLINHDEAFNLFGKGATVTSGRWALGALDTIFPNYSMPWVNGMMTLVFMAVAVSVMVHVLSIRSKTLQALLAGTVVAFPSLIGTFAYMFTSNAFGLSFLLAVAAVWFVSQNRPLYVIPALGCMVFSLGIYQSYIAVAAGLLVLILIRQLLTGEKVQSVLFRGVYYVLFLVVSLGMYYVLTQIALKLVHEVLNSYASENVSFSLASIPTNILLAYQSFFRILLEGFHGLIPTGFSRILHLAMVLLTLVLLILSILSAKKKEPGRILLLLALFAVFPLAVCCMYLFTTADSIHTLVLYGFVGVYALAVMVSDLCMDTEQSCKLRGLFRTVSLNLISLLLALIISCNVFLANEVWLNLQLRYENAFAFYSSLLSDLRTMPEFTEEMPVALIGYYTEPAFYEKEFFFCEILTGTKGFKPDSYSAEEFFRYYLGVTLPFAESHVCEALAQQPEVMQMPCYPYYGSVQVIDGTIIVKLS